MFCKMRSKQSIHSKYSKHTITEPFIGTLHSSVKPSQWLHRQYLVLPTLLLLGPLMQLQYDRSLTIR